jgi:hypothetical protein
MPLEPINYLAQTQGQDIGNELLSSMKLGEAIRGIRTARAADEQAAQTKVQYAADLKSAFDNPTPESFAMLSTKYPTQREAFKQSFDMLEAPKKASEMQTTGQVYTALLNNKPEIANGIIDEHITALENSGQDASKLKQIKTTIEKDPNTATGIAGFMLSNMMGQKEFKDYQDAIGTAGKEKREQILFPEKQAQEAIATQKAGSDAATAAVKAKFAESDAAIELQKKGWDIKKIASDIEINKMNSKIAAMNAATNREGNSLKRQELGLKLQDMYLQRDDKVREKTATVDTARSSMDNFLNTADRILKTPKGVVNSATGPVSSRMPTLSSDTADFEELVTTLGSQAFMAQIPNMKGTGALSDAEGAKLSTSLQNLSLRQSPERLLKNVQEAQRLIMKARKNVATKYGVPDTVPNTPEATTSPKNIDALLKKYGG